jgi:hypothetical protein
MRPAACSFIILLSMLSVRAEEAPIDASVFFSGEDPLWKETEKAIDAVQKKFPRLRIAKVSIDNDEGYKKLAEAEKAAAIKNPGDVTLVMGPLSLTSKGERRDIEKYFEPMVDRLLNPEKAKGRGTVDLKKYAAEIFGKDAKLEGGDDGENVVEDHTSYNRVTVGGKPAGYVVNAFRHIHCPVCNDAHFVMAVSSPELKTLDLRPVRELERLGAKLDDKEAAAFTAQFKERAPDNAAAKINIISGATKTSRAYEKAVVEIMQELKKRERP